MTCIHIKDNGQRCGASVHSGYGPFCYWHGHGKTLSSRKYEADVQRRVRMTMNQFNQESFLL